VTIPTYSGLGTALSGLEAMQAGIDTTSENISNASNPDYADETVNLVDSPSLTFYTGEGGNPPVELGTGVGIQSITRNDNQFIDGQYWTANANSSYYSTLSNQLSDTEDDLNTSSTSGLQSALNSFYSAWQTLSTNSSATQGSTVISEGQTLAQQLNQASQQISTLQSQAGDEVTSLTSSGGELDQYATDIAQLNTQIAAASAAGLSSNSLQDQRATVIGQLSALANIKVTQQTNGSDTITLMNNSTVPATQVGSSPLVDGGNGTSVPTGSAAVTLPAASDLSSIGGTIGALAQLADTDASDPNAPLAQMQTELNTLASGIASDVNTASGTSFFTPNDGTSTITAANISVDSSVTSSTLAGLSSTTATAVYNTSNDATNDLATFVGQVGNTVGQASDSATTASSLLSNISNERQSVSGVSLDQEMTNLITYQQGYQASARVMNAMQSVIQTLISSVGGAGV
jgi:flagellar hook-associated protein 1 FlgK